VLVSCAWMKAKHVPECDLAYQKVQIRSSFLCLPVAQNFLQCILGYLSDALLWVLFSSRESGP
jgi:hypothetical protein